MQSNANVLQVENIITRFNTQDGKVFAVNGISFDLKEGELLGVVGESGSGKSVTMMSLLELLPMPPAEIVEGRALFENQDLIQMNLNQLRKIRGGKIGFIFQDPMTSGLWWYIECYPNCQVNALRTARYRRSRRRG